MLRRTGLRWPKQEREVVAATEKFRLQDAEAHEAALKKVVVESRAAHMEELVNDFNLGAPCKGSG